jgi:hypothetical protein
MGTLHEDLCTFMIISHPIILRMGDVSQKDVDKIKKNILCSATFSENRAVHDNMEKIL